MSDISEACRLRRSRFVHFCTSNFLLHIYVFLLIPLIGQRAEKCGADESLLAWAVLLFAVGMFLPGALGAYLMERYSRKSVGLWSVLALGALALLPAILPNEPAWLVLPYGLQGICFGLAQIALGSTLVNDVLLSHERDRGDILYAWAGRVGIPVGLLAGMLLPQMVSADMLGWYALAPCALAFLFIAGTSVPLKAPVRVAVVSLDRFLLPRSLYLSLSLFPAPFVLGYAVMHGGAMCALLFTAGFAIVFVGLIVLHLSVGERLGVTLGYSLIICALAAFSFDVSVSGAWVAYSFIGAGVSLVSSHHLLHWVTLAKHCQRGTAQNTYMLSWRVAFSLGLACAYFLPAFHVLGLISLCLAAVCLYLSWPHRLYTNKG